MCLTFDAEPGRIAWLHAFFLLRTPPLCYSAVATTNRITTSVANLRYTRCLNTMHTRVAAVGMEGDNPADRLQMLDLCLKTVS